MIDTTHFPKARKYWYQGKMRDWSELVLHPMAHALHYGTSAFEGIRAYETAKGPAVFRLPEHIDRLFYSASAAWMTPPFSKEEVTAAVKRVVLENGLASCYIRPLLYFGYGNLGLVPKASRVELVIAAWEWGAYLGEKAEEGVSVYIVPRRRVHHSQLDMRAKLGGVYVQSTIGGLDARAHEAEEAVFLNMEGRIAEGPGENIFVVKDGRVRTNDRSESVLEGITRTSVLEVARDLGFETSVGPIAKEDLIGADEAFFTGTAVEVVPVIRISDGSAGGAATPWTPVGPGKPGPVALRIRQTYLELVRGKHPRYEKWLTPVSG